MKDKPLLILAVTTVILVVAAWLATVQRLPETVLERSILYPDLLSNINEVAKLEITSKEQHTVLSQENNRWVIDNRGGYPALFEEVKRTLVNVANLKIREGKTSKPELYSKLHVEDLEQPDAQSTRLTLRDATGDLLADVLIGKEPTSAASRDLASLYVRPVGQDQALLVDGELEVSADPSDWLNSQLLNVEASRLATLRITHPDGEQLIINKSDPLAADYDLIDVPEDKEIKSKSLLNSQMTILEDLRFDDVLPAAGQDFPAATAIQSRFEAFDGLVVEIETAETEAGLLSRFNFNFDAGLENEGAPSAESGDATEEKPESVADEVAELNQRVSGWLYKLPEFQVKKLIRRLDDLVKNKTTSPAAAAPNSDQQLQQLPQLQ